MIVFCHDKQVTKVVFFEVKQTYSTVNISWRR
jgi:hypothetical protein